MLQRQVDAAGEGGAGGDGDEPGRSDAGDVLAADELAGRFAAGEAGEFGGGAVGRFHVNIGDAGLRRGGEPFAEEADAEDRAHGDMGGGDWQAEPAGDDDGDGGGQGDAIGPHRIELGDRVAHHADELWPEQHQAEGDARGADHHHPERDSDPV